MESPAQKEYIFEQGTAWLPGISKWTRILFKILSLPGGNHPWVQQKLKLHLSLPESTHFQPGFNSLAGRLRCGQHVALGDTLFVDYAPVFIGDYVGFSFRNMVITSSHDLKNFDRVVARPVVIEDHVWITSGVTILGGVRIGRNSVIGAGSVVCHDIPPNVFAAGNPCRVIREIERGGL